MTYAGLPPGGWFGEGTTIKREPYRYNIRALRKSVRGGLPIDSFHWLLDHSIGFNRFVMNQLNERLGQFIAAREIDRLNNLRRARGRSPHRCSTRCCTGRGRGAAHHAAGAGLPGGLSRQRVNEALFCAGGARRHSWSTAACACWTWPRCGPA